MKQAFGINVPQTLADVCDRSRLALVVYDMQVGIVSQLPGAGAVTARVARVLEASRGAGHADAAQRSCEALRFAGDAIMTDTEAFCAALGKTRA